MYPRDALSERLVHPARFLQYLWLDHKAATLQTLTASNNVNQKKNHQNHAIAIVASMSAKECGNGNRNGAG